MTKVDVKAYQCDQCRKLSPLVASYDLNLPDGWEREYRKREGGGHYDIPWTETYHYCSDCSAERSSNPDTERVV